MTVKKLKTMMALVCDDQEDHYQDMKKHLKREGYECYKRVDTEEGIRVALEEAKKNGRWFDVILIDMDLSGAKQGANGELIYNSLSKDYPEETYLIYSTLDADKIRSAISRLALKNVRFVLLDKNYIRLQLYQCLSKTDPKTIFLVHGRDNNKVNTITKLLEEGFGLNVIPFESTHALANNPKKYIYDLILAGIQHTHATVVLFSDDEEVELRPEFLVDSDFEKIRKKQSEKRRQSRGNVLIEAGYAFGVRPNRTIFLKWADPKAYFDLPSDFAGSHYLSYDDKEVSRTNLKNRLINCRCDITLNGDWERLRY